MIHANELRIGNICIGASRGDYVTITGRMLAQLEEGKLNLLPVPLTAEILEGCGFVKEVHNVKYDFYGYRLGNLILYRVHNNALSDDWYYQAEYCASDFEERTHIISRMDYLHQLQNLYFALTYDELPVNQSA